MFSLLSQGYGTYDGIAKKDAQETHEHKVNCSQLASGLRFFAPLVDRFNSKT